MCACLPACQAHTADQALLDAEDTLKRVLKEATAELPWWCICKHEGSVWDSEEDDNGLGDLLNAEGTAHRTHTRAHRSPARHWWETTLCIVSSA